VAAFGLADWETLSTRREWPVLLVGNGLSRAVSDRFAYDSLYKDAPLSDDDRDLFNAMRTRNFEEVLNHLRTAELVCTQLGHKSRDVRRRYRSIQEALIAAVHEHHVEWLEVNEGRRLLKIRKALGKFQSIFTTSYDLLIYWAIMSSGSPPGNGFGDMFWNSNHKFDPLDTEPIGTKTLIYWLHGGLHFYRNQYRETVKNTSGDRNLLNTFASSSRIPLFVSEGTSRQKRYAIRRSDYLEFVYDTFANTPDDLVVFGQALSPSDSHLVTAINQWPGRHVAFGVFATDRADADLKKAQVKDLLRGTKLHFFDSTSHPLGDPRLVIDV